MTWDEERPKPVAGIVVGENLETLSVAELEQRIARLGAEIQRTEAELGRKRAHEAAAQSLFKR